LAIDLTKESSVANGSGNTTTLNVPANTVDGDFLLAWIYVQSNTDNHASANGFTRIVNQLNATGNISRASLWWKRALGEGATVVFTHGNSTRSGCIKRFPGVIATGNPLDASISLNSVELGQVVTCASISTGSSNSAVVLVGARVPAPTWTLETLTARIKQNGVNGGASMFADIQAAAGATGVHSAKNGTTNNYLHGALIALKPLVPETDYMPDKWWRNTEQPPAFLHKNRIVGY